MSVIEGAAVEQRKQYIGGRWVNASGGGTFDDLNPFTGEVMATVAAGSRDDAAAAVSAAAEAFPAWAATPPEQKQRLLLKTADIVEARSEEIKRVLAQETGGGSTFAGF